METGENQLLNTLRENQALLGPHLPQLLFFFTCLLTLVCSYFSAFNNFLPDKWLHFSRPRAWGTFSVTVK